MGEMKSMLLILATGLSAVSMGSRQEGAPRLSLPIACEPRKTCFIQSYVDTVPGPERRDYACGSATQDEHKGTDFRVLSIAVAREGVAVLAAADGTVKARRDGMPDALVAGGKRNGIKGRECGNGVVLDHGGGWETQYCHMRRDSVSVEEGHKVHRGQQLGNVGYSGLAQFAHLHFEVRHNGQVIDPFSGRGRNGACDRNPRDAGGLWDEKAFQAFPYANGEIIAAFFTTQVPALDELEEGQRAEPPSRHSGKFIYVARFTNLRAGDRVRLVVNGPADFALETATKPLDRDKATYLAFVGRRRTRPFWPQGRYEGRVELLRGGAVAAAAQTDLQLLD